MRFRSSARRRTAEPADAPGNKAVKLFFNGTINKKRSPDVQSSVSRFFLSTSDYGSEIVEQCLLMALFTFRFFIVRLIASFMIVYECRLRGIKIFFIGNEFFAEKENEWRTWRVVSFIVEICISLCSIRIRTIMGLILVLWVFRKTNFKLCKFLTRRLRCIGLFIYCLLVQFDIFFVKILPTVHLYQKTLHRIIITLIGNMYWSLWVNHATLWVSELIKASGQ